MIKFVNAHDDHRGNVLWIDSTHIVAVYEKANVRGGSLSTTIYGSTGIEWTVEESLNEVIRQLQPHGMLTE